MGHSSFKVNRRILVFSLYCQVILISLNNLTKIQKCIIKLIRYGNYSCSLYSFVVVLHIIK